MPIRFHVSLTLPLIIDTLLISLRAYLRRVAIAAMMFIFARRHECCSWLAAGDDMLRLILLPPERYATEEVTGAMNRDGDIKRERYGTCRFITPDIARAR